MKLTQWFAGVAAAGALIAVGLLAAGSRPVPTTYARADENGSTETRSPGVRVTAARLQRKTLELATTQPARVEAFEETALVSKIAGYVDEVRVDIGDTVKKDQVLLTVSVPELRDELAQKEALVLQADAEVKQAEAALQAARAAVDTAQAGIGQAEAGVARAEGDYQSIRSEYERIKQLAASGSVTQKLVDETLNQFRAAEAGQMAMAASLRSAKASLAEAEAGVVKAQADQGAAAARLQVAQANRRQAETMLRYAEIRAPFDGIVTQRSVDTGHYVQPAGTAVSPLLVVTSVEKIRVFVDIPEMEAPLVDGGEQGDPATIRIQSLGDRQFTAPVTRTGWSLDQTNRSLRTEIDLPNPDGAIRPGMYANASILLERRTGALALPITAIVRDGGKTWCCCVVAGRIERRPIELGLRSANEVEVVSGLDGTEIVVLARADSLSPGEQAEVLPPEG
ncbi:MAG: efflux RND transporter periplasmic adaptor subunit [Thermoguttaceae bacterium]